MVDATVRFWIFAVIEILMNHTSNSKLKASNLTTKQSEWTCPGRVFCKKGCFADGETWEECKYYSVFFLSISFKLF